MPFAPPRLHEHSQTMSPFPDCFLAPSIRKTFSFPQPYALLFAAGLLQVVHGCTFGWKRSESPNGYRSLLSAAAASASMLERDLASPELGRRRERYGFVVLGSGLSVTCSKVGGAVGAAAAAAVDLRFLDGLVVAAGCGSG